MQQLADLEAELLEEIAEFFLHPSVSAFIQLEKATFGQGACLAP